jgi:hypothetical protein
MKAARKTVGRNEAEKAAKEINELRRKRLGDYIKRQEKIRAAEKKLEKFKRIHQTKKLKAEAASRTIMTRGRARIIKEGENTGMNAPATTLATKAKTAARGKTAKKEKTAVKAANATFNNISGIFKAHHERGFKEKKRAAIRKHMEASNTKNSPNPAANELANAMRKLKINSDSDSDSDESDSWKRQKEIMGKAPKKD